MNYDHRVESSSVDFEEDDLSFLVWHLNQTPFHMNLRLIDFASKTEFELVEILDRVFYEIEFSHDEKSDQSEKDYELSSFLFMLKCPCIPHEGEELLQWFKKIRMGEKSVLYPLMKWMLGSLEKLKKRAYLVPFLAPIDIPPQLLLSSSESKQGILLPLIDRYRSLQLEFKELHKRYDSEYYKEHGDVVQILKSHLDRLALEKKQLINDIQQIKDNTRVSKDKSFLNMLETISTSRKVHQENSHLNEGLREQSELLSLEESQVKSLKRYLDRLYDLTITSMVDSSSRKPSDDQVDQILNVIRCEIEQLETVTNAQLKDDCKSLEDDIVNLEKETLVPYRTNDEVKNVRNLLIKLQKQLETKKDGIFEHQTKKRAALDQVLVFIKEAENSAVNVQSKDSEVRSKREQIDILRREIRDLARAIESRNIQGEENLVLDDGSFVSKSKVNELKIANEAKAHYYVVVVKDLERKSNEVEIVTRTNSILTERYRQTEERFMRMEEKTAIADMYNTSDFLNKTAEEEAQANTMKCEALKEINDMVKTITMNLESNMGTFKPMIQKLKSARYMASEVETNYLQKKANYDNVSSIQSNVQEKLENECDTIQEKWLCAERRYHYLDNMIDTVQSNLQHAVFEGRCQQGLEHYSSEFPSLDALYKNQIMENEVKSKHLQMQLNTMEQSESSNIQQRKLFIALQNVLQLKQAMGLNFRIQETSIKRHEIPI